MNIKEIIIIVAIYIAIDLTSEVMQKIHIRRKMKKARKVIGEKLYDKMYSSYKIIGKALLTGDASKITEL